MTDRSPRALYVERLDARRQAAAALWAEVRRLGTLRLLAAAAFIAMAVGVTELKTLPGWALLFPLAAFVALVFRHRDVYEAWERANRAADSYDDGIHRIDDAWQGRGASGQRFADPTHPYSGDLDLFGDGSLFELLCLARSRGGEERLASWLLGPAEVEAIRERQAAVAELREAVDLREALRVATAERAVIDHSALARWGDRPIELTARWPRWVALVLGIVSFGALIYWAVELDPWPFLIMSAIEQPFAAFWRGGVAEVVKGIDRPRRDLDLLARFLAPFERVEFRAPLLVRLGAALDGNPSARLRKLIRLMEYTESYRNIFFAPFGVVLLWAFQFAFAIEEWRARDGARVKVWLDALAELEALLSLSGFAFEHPADVFPELDGGGPRFAGRGLTHPLLPQARAIRNDVSLSAERQLMLVSGSNMAGKSSLLRTVGVNTVLALAGSTVRAESLAVSRLAVGAAMRVQDSLQQGVSHFYAEIKRLRQIVELTEGEGRTALLFLFDEILHGTNSYDRSIGAEAVVRTLVERGAIGLVTTHDLALTRIVDHLGARALNVHFQDELVDGKMTFDYRLREGVVEKSNAIALMRAVGLEV
jgi:hypothetical protein